MVTGRALARGVLTVSGARILGLVVTLVQVKLTVTYLGPTAYGLLVTATMFVNSFGAWTDMGMGGVVVRRVSGRQQSLQHTVGLSMAVTVLVMAPLFVATNVTAYVLYRDQPVVLLGAALLSCGLLASSWLACYNPIAQVTGRFGHFAAADLVGRLLSISLIVVAVNVEAGMAAFFIAQLFVPVGQMFAMMRLGRLVGRFRPVWNWREMWALIRETLPLTYIGAVGVLYFNIDGVMLSQLSSPEMVGAYGLAYKIAANFTIVSASLAAVMAGRLAADAALSHAAFRRTVHEALRFVLLVAVPLSTLVGPLAPELVRFIGSEEMVPVASHPLTLVAIGVAVGMVSAVVSGALISDYQQRTLTILNTVNLLINIGLNFAFIPRYGASGAALSLVITESVGLIVCLVLMARRYGSLVPWATLARFVPAILLALGVEYLLRDEHGMLRVVVVGVTYAAGVFLFGVVRLRDLGRLRSRGATA